MLEPDFWKGKRVLVTGHTGFKGAWLCLWLNHLGARVTGYALPPPSDPSLFEMGGVAELIEHRLGDVRDLPALEAALKDKEHYFQELVAKLEVTNALFVCLQSLRETEFTRFEHVDDPLQLGRQAASARMLALGRLLSARGGGIVPRGFLWRRGMRHLRSGSTGLHLTRIQSESELLELGRGDLAVAAVDDLRFIQQGPSSACKAP